MIRSQLDPNQPHLVLDEQEPDGRGGQVDTLTIFLTAAECPIGCHMCDLSKNTLTTATPTGAIPTQIDAALHQRQRRGWIKLYNSGNFFDPRSIPPDDYAEIAKRCEDFSRVVVENHPRFGAERLRSFRRLLDAPLEVAVGLETVQPRWLDRYGKQMSRDEFDRHARWLRGEAVDLRVFLIVAVPGISTTEAIRWTRLSIRHAISCQARHISLIPARPWPHDSARGDTARSQASLSHDSELPQFSLEMLCELQALAIQDADGRAVVTVDLWDVDPNAGQFRQLQRTNLVQKV